MRLLIDADSIVYSCGFAAETATHLAWDPLNGKPLGPVTDDKRAAKELGGVLFTNRSEEPIENCLHSVKLQIAATVASFEDKFKEPPSEVEVYLTGGGNYRERVATIRPYKGNRDLNHKPLHMGAIRKYLCDVWSARVVHGIEADDAVSIIQSLEHDDVVVSSIDKDLLQVPGIHYVHGKGWKNISKQEGLQRLYVQILAGDPTDNIPGCWKVGRTKAIDVIKPLKRAEDMWTAAVEWYETSLRKWPEDCGYSDAHAAALETARLVYMLREWPPRHAHHGHDDPGIYVPTDLWEPPV